MKNIIDDSLCLSVISWRKICSRYGLSGSQYASEHPVFV